MLKQNKNKTLFWGETHKNTKLLNKNMPFPQTCREGISAPVVAKTVRLATWQVGGGNYDLSRGIFNEKVYSNYKGGMLEAHWHCSFFFFDFFEFAIRIRYILHMIFKKTCNIELRHIETFKYWICVSHIDTVSYRLYTHRCMHVCKYMAYG